MTELIGKNLTLDTRLLDVSFTLQPRRTCCDCGTEWIRQNESDAHALGPAKA